MLFVTNKYVLVPNKINALVADRVLIADRLTHLLTFKKYIKLTLL